MPDRMEGETRPMHAAMARCLRRCLSALMVVVFAYVGVLASAANAGGPSQRYGRPLAQTASCVQYSPWFVVHNADFAFAGRVTSVGTVRETSGESRYLSVLPVKLKVDEWYVGHYRPRLRVLLPVGFSVDPLPPKVVVGTKLLVSGVDRGRDGRRVAFGCGFTRYYNDADAAGWRAAATDYLRNRRPMGWWRS